MTDSIFELCRGIAELKKQAKALGLFTHDRELLKCEECQLYEDVTFEGVLITEFGDNYVKDTGLRFIETEESNIFICPKCGKRIAAEEEDLFDE